MKKTLLALVAALLALTGCTQNESVEPDKVVAIVILKEVWDSYSPMDQFTVCSGWIEDSDRVLDKFFSSNTSDYLTRDEARAFFDYECLQ